MTRRAAVVASSFVLEHVPDLVRYGSKPAREPQQLEALRRSLRSFEDAVQQGIQRATQTLRGVTAAWIKDQRVKLENGKVTEYQVNLKITFVLDQ